MNAVSPFHLDIAAVIRRTSKTRRPRIVLNSINPPAYKAADLARAYHKVSDVWASGATQMVIPAYTRALSSITTDSPADDMAATVSAIENYAVQAVVNFGNVFQSWFTSYAIWHRNKIISNLRYSTNVNLDTVIGQGDLQDTFASLLARNVSLVRSVSDQTRQRISDIVYSGLQNRTPVNDVARQINEATGLARDRSTRIASDQTVKASAALDRERMEQLGITSFVWMHSGKVHYRPWHKARDGETFRFDDESLVGDHPGEPPFCGCKARGVINLG